MHEGQVDVDEGALSHAIAHQFPEYSGRPPHRVDSAGTVVAPFRVGVELLARLPLVPENSPEARRRLHREHAHALHLVGRLPIEVPAPIGVGEHFPGNLVLWTWLHGVSLDRAAVADTESLACDGGGPHSFTPEHAHRRCVVERDGGASCGHPPSSGTTPSLRHTSA